MKLVAVSSILALAASETLLDRARQSELLRNLLNVNIIENANGFNVETVYGDLNVQRNPPMATLVNGANSITAGRDDGLFMEFNVVNKADMNENFVAFLDANNRCDFDTLNSRAELAAADNGIRFTHVGQTNNGEFSEEATIAVQKAPNTRRVTFSFKSSGASGVCDFDLNREARGFASVKRENENYRFKVGGSSGNNKMSGQIIYTPSRISASATVNGQTVSNSINAADGTWTTTSAVNFNIAGGSVTLPGPGNMAAVRAAIENQFNWVAELANNGRGADALAIILHADAAAQLLEDHLDFTPVLRAMKLDFPMPDVCDEFPATCGHATFQAAAPAIARSANDKAVAAIQEVTGRIAPEVRSRLQNALNNGVPQWYKTAMA